MKSDEPTPKRAIIDPPKPQPTWLKPIILGCIVLAFVILVGVGVSKLLSTPSETSAPTSSTPPTSQDGTSPLQPHTEDCTTFTGSMTGPSQMEITTMGIQSPIVVVGKDEDGNPGAPDPEDAFTTAWYNRSPAPGTTKGNVILTIHTYSTGTALGNEMMDPQYGVTPETMFIITDDLGNKVCYASTGQTKVMVDEYDPDSDIFHNLEGPPQLAIMVCSDYNKTTGEWDSRVIFYAELLRQA